MVNDMVTCYKQIDDLNNGFLTFNYPFLWNHVKNKVYQAKTENIEDFNLE